MQHKLSSKYNPQLTQTDRAMRRVTSVVLYTTADAQCDKAATDVGRTKLTTLQTVDEPRLNFTQSDFGTKFQREIPLFLQTPNFLET